LDLSQVRQAGEPLKGFGGTANPVRLQTTLERVAGVLTAAVGRKLDSVETCLIIDEAASAVVAGNIRRSAGMRQFSSGDSAATEAKDGLYKQDIDGNWSVNPVKEALRMANHTRCFHHKPTLREVQNAVTKQYWSGEGAIMYVPEAVARANADLLNSLEKKLKFLELYATKGRELARDYLIELAHLDGQPTNNRIINHRMDRYGLNPCFAAGTIVMTRRGYYPIEDLVGKTVEIHDGNKWVEIDNFRVTAHDQDIYTITLHSGLKISATRYHKFILEDGTRVQLKDLRVNDKLMMAKTGPVQGTVEVNGAYLKGFLIGDGTSTKDKRAMCRIYKPKEICVKKLCASQHEIGLVEKTVQSGITVGVETGLTATGFLKSLTSMEEDMYDWARTYKKTFPLTC